MHSDAYGIRLNLLAKAAYDGTVTLIILSTHCP